MVVNLARTVNSDLTLPLIHLVETDDIFLEQSAQAEWFPILRDLRWQDYRELAAAYYEALAEFNEDQAQQRRERESPSPPSEESRDDARQRLLFERPTSGKAETPPLFELPSAATPIRIDPQTLAPGLVPLRLAGRQPKCFFAMFRAFVGVTLMGRPAEPEEVHHQLTNNPSFARACNYTLPKANGLYRQTDLPSLRKLEQFDQIMTASGLWSRCKWEELRRNLLLGKIEPERELVHDTTHYLAYSSFETVHYEDDRGKVHKKSQSKLTKACRCEDWEQCPHDWQLRDDGAGTVVKGTGRMYWAHKASVLALPHQGIPLDAVAMTDAASHDSNAVVPHLQRLQEHEPALLETAQFVLDDGAADDPNLRKKIEEAFGLTLRASLNPRRRKPVTEGLPRGMSQLTPYGELECQADRRLEYLGVRWNQEVFLYGPPQIPEGDVACLTCPLKETCCPRATHGRHVSLPFDSLPHINPEDPPMSKRFRAMMTLRPAVERVIKIIKCDLGDPHLSKRGNAAFQARLDKTLIAFHLLLRR